MIKIDSNTKYILFVFFLVLFIVIYAYEDNFIVYQQPRYVKTNLYDENNNNLSKQYYIYNQSFIDDLQPSYIS
jgi:hypothetical protein